AAAVALSRTDYIDPLVLRRHAEQFSRPRFLTAIRNLIDEALTAQHTGRLTELEQSFAQLSLPVSR
ncbi:MAG: glycosyl transferase, partial [Chloroflexus aggregans]